MYFKYDRYFEYILICLLTNLSVSHPYIGASNTTKTAGTKNTKPTRAGFFTPA